MFSHSLQSRRIISGVLLASMVTATACATYRPIDRRIAARGIDVRLDLTERGTLELGSVLGPSIVSLDGQVRGVTDSTFRISVTQVLSRTGDAQVWTGEVVSVPAAFVNGFRKREASRSRTYLLTAAIVTGAILTGVAFKAGTSGNGKPVDGPIQR